MPSPRPDWPGGKEPINGGLLLVELVELLLSGLVGLLCAVVVVSAVVWVMQWLIS
jgi:hypothetical protein